MVESVSKGSVEEFMVGLPIVNRRTGLTKRRKPYQDCRDLNGHEDSSAAQAEDAKFDSARETSSTQP